MKNIKIDKILDRIINNIEFNHPLKYKDKEGIEIKVIITSLSYNFIKENIDIEVQPGKPYRIKRGKYIFFIFDDFYDINNEKTIHPLSIFNKYKHIYYYYNFKIYEDYETSIHKRGNFRIDYKIL